MSNADNVPDVSSQEPLLTWRHDEHGRRHLVLADFGHGVSVNEQGVIHLSEALPTPEYARRIASALAAAAEWVEIPGNP